MRQIRRALHACSEDCIADAVPYGAEHLPTAEAARRVRALRAACRQAEVARTAAMSLADRAARGDPDAREELPGALRDLERTADLQRQHDFTPVSSMRGLLEEYIAGDLATLDEYGGDLDGALARLRDSHGEEAGAEAGGREVELMEFGIVWWREDGGVAGAAPLPLGFDMGRGV